MADEWFVRVQGKDYGPVDLDTLREWKREGRLIAENEVRQADGDAWVKAQTLFATLTDAPVSTAPPPSYLRPRSFAQIIGETFRIYRKGWLTFFVLAIIVAIPSTAAQICFPFLHFAQPEPASPIALTVATVATAFLFTLWPIFVAGIQIASADAAAGQTIRLRDVLQRAVRFWPEIAKLSLIVYGNYFVWSVVPVLVILSLVASRPGIVSVLLATGILALQVFMTARLWVNFLFWQQIGVLEKPGTLQTLRESQRLARTGATAPWHERPVWRGALLASIWILLLIIVSSASEIPFLLVRLEGVGSPEEMIAKLQSVASTPIPDVLTIASYIFSSLIHALLRPLLGIVFVVLYFDAKARAG
jgi:hypothetical protein